MLPDRVVCVCRTGRGGGGGRKGGCGGGGRWRGVGTDASRYRLIDCFNSISVISV